MPTDAELLCEWAEKVMGWKVESGPTKRHPSATKNAFYFTPPDRSEIFCWNVEGEWRGGWNPLTSDNDLWAGVDAICALGYWFRLQSPWESKEARNPDWRAGFTAQGCSPWNGRMDFEAQDPDRRRAIFLACLMAAREERNAVE